MKKRKRGIIVIIFVSCMLMIQCFISYKLIGNTRNIDKYICYAGNSNLQFINNQNLRDDKYDINEFIQLVGFAILYVIIMQIDKIRLNVILFYRHVQSEKLRRSLEKNFSIYSKKNLKNLVKETVTKIYKAFSNMDVDSVKDYLQRNTYDIYKSRAEWMKIRHEGYLNSDSKLINLKLIGLEHYNDISKDKVYFYVKLKRKNKKKRKRNIKEKKNYNKDKLLEVWEFTIEDNNWVLHKILKINNLDDFMQIKAFCEK